MLIVVTAQPRVATLTDMMQPLTGPEESGPECRPGVLYTALYCSTAVLLYTSVQRQGQVSGTLGLQSAE